MTTEEKREKLQAYIAVASDKVIEAFYSMLEDGTLENGAWAAEYLRYEFRHRLEELENQ